MRDGSKVLRLTVALAPLLLAACAAEVGLVPAAVASNDTQILATPGQEVDRSGQSLEVGRSVYGKFLAARHAEALGDFGAAATLLAEIADDVPDQMAVLRRVHLLMATEGRVADAQKYAARVVAEQSDAPLAAVTMAIGHLGNGDYETAAVLLREADRGGANRLVVPLLLAWSLAGAGETADALSVLGALGGGQALDLIEGLHSGLVADFAGLTDKADAAFKRTVDAGETTPLRVIEAYVSFLSREGRWDEAQAVMETFLGIVPDSILIEPAAAAIVRREALPPVVESAADGAAEALAGVARALSRDGNSLTGMYLVRMSLQLRPEDPSTRLLLGQLLQDQERLDEALAAYGEVDPASPYNWLARLSRAQVLDEQDRAEEAFALLQTMIAERPERSDAAHTLGDLLRVNERFSEAVGAYDDAVARLDDIDTRHWRLLYTRGIALERSKQWDRAEDDFLTALDLQPDQPHVLNYLGYSWVEQGINLDEARRMIEKAVEQRPRDGFIVDSMGWVLYRLGEYQPAVGHLERAVALEPADPVINDHLGDAYWLVGRFQEAAFQWQRALEAGPEPDLAADIEAKLRGEKRPEPSPPGDGQDS